MSNPASAPAIVLRDIDSVPEMHQVEVLEKDVWGCDDLDVLPVTMFAAGKAVGAVLVGAYDAEDLVGFVYGFPGFEHGRPTHHSHMLAVMPAYRNCNLAYRLKLAQRERVLAQGITRITWTFDPLQSLNAYFNFSKLGVLADAYKVNFYGEVTSSFLHQIGTDRLWVSWLLKSRRVQERLHADKSASIGSPEEIAALVEVNSDQTPQRHESAELLTRQQVRIEVPSNINALQQANPELALRWREATRWAFTASLSAGYLVEENVRMTRADVPLGSYILTRGSLPADV